MTSKKSRNAREPLVIGVTGGIASGKTTVLKELERLGAVIYSADEIARRILEPGGAAYASVVHAFGPEIVDGERRLDRSALAARIFADPAERKRLESLMHPLILEQLRSDLAAFRAHPPNRPPIAAAEIPLLYEASAEGLVDEVLVAAVEQERQFTRLKQRTEWPDSRVWAAIHSQLPLPQKVARADWVIRTDSETADTLAQTRAFWERITDPFKEDPPCP